jgi:gas vesicle protein
MTLLKNLIKVGGSAVILKEIADRIRDTRINREQTLRRNRTGMLALGVAIGSTVGVVAGVLFAPKAGKETREELSRYGCDTWGKVKDNVSTTGQRLVNSVEEKSSRMRTAAEKGVDAAKESFKELSGEREEGNG